MSFLLPALAALVSDALVLYLNHVKEVTSPDEITGPHKWLYHVRYTLALAIIRLILLVFPLPYHSYTGTAIKFQLLYQLFYFVSLIILLVHMISIIMLDPDSLTSLVTNTTHNHTSTRGLTLTIQEDIDIRTLLDHSSLQENMRVIWLILGLSLFSDLLHLLLLWNVRSSAPRQWDWKYRKHVLYYFAQQQQQQQQRLSISDNSIQPPMILQDEDNDIEIQPHRPPKTQQQGTLFRQQMQLPGALACVPDGYDAFMAQLHGRLEVAREQWAKRLDEFTNRWSELNSPDSNLNGSLHLPVLSNTGGAPALRFPRPPRTAFSVLLQLFAYENAALDQLDYVFSEDDAIFYVPQLLSFLLFNAFDTAPQLEEWILKQCRKNIYFAHRCFWFLRSWCLEVGGLKAVEEEQQQQQLQQQKQSSFAAQIIPNHSLHSGPPPKSTSQNSLASMLEEMQQTAHAASPKYPPEERSVMEGLLCRVIECGEIPANTLQYGTPREREVIRRQYKDGDTKLPPSSTSTMVVDSPSSYLAAAQSGLLPMDPNTGFPSVGHLDTVTAERTFGFLPLRDDGGNGNVPAAHDVFMTTPRFLDALMRLADALFLVPRENRTDHLRKHLRVMETEWLPSNAIYLPVNNIHHRVWRIVADESIALSTKERVPCIICLEVVDFSPDNQQTQQQQQQPSFDRQSGNPLTLSPTRTSTAGQGTPSTPKPFTNRDSISSERRMVRLWSTTPRNPRRHDTLLEKVTMFTNESLRKMRVGPVPDNLLWISDPPNQRRVALLGQEEEMVAMPPPRDEPKDGIFRDLSSTEDLLSASPNNAAAAAAADSKQGPANAMGQWYSPPSPQANRQRRKLFPDRYRDKQDEYGYYYENMTEDVHVMDALVGIRNRNNVMEERGGIRDLVTGKTSSAASTSTASSSNNSHNGEVAYGSTQRSPHRMPPVVFKESWDAKQSRLRSKSAFGSDPSWRLMPILIKSNDDLRQEQLASQLIYRMATILAKEKIPVWLSPYEIVALTDRGGIIEAIPDTISIDSLKRNHPDITSLAEFFSDHFGEGTDEHLDAKANFIESLAAYSIVCFLLQIKDRHNGNILMDNRGHVIHIDFGFFFLSSPGKNSGFESAPFKLTRDFVDIMDGPNSHAFRTFRELCARTFLCLRKHCYEITLLVEMLMVGNEDLNCFRGRPQEAVRLLRERFRLDLNDRACHEYVNALVDESLENWRTRWYDRYQRFCVGVL